MVILNVLIGTLRNSFRNETETRALEPGQDHLRLAGRGGQEVVAAGRGGRPGRPSRAWNHFATTSRRKGDFLIRF